MKTTSQPEQQADLLLLQGNIVTLNPQQPRASSVAIKDGRFLAVGDECDTQVHKGQHTQMIDLKGRTVIPGLNDSHIHMIRGGLSYTMELRWDGVPSLADALRMLKEQAQRTPPPQWVRVIGGWTQFQFAERRMPTLEEINAVAPDTPVFVLNLYACALLNKAALQAVGYTRDTPSPKRGEIQKDSSGYPTGLLLAQPDAALLYSTLAKGPTLGHDDQVNSTCHFMRELNRLGLTSVVDAGGGFQRYPEDYQIIEELNQAGQLTLRIAYNLFPQQPGKEVEDFQRWFRMTRPGQGDEHLRVNGIGEKITDAAYDFENFQFPQPEISSDVNASFKEAVSLIVEHRWPFRLHATYDESIGHYLDLFEDINRTMPFNGLRWFFDHAETITPKNIERVKALGGGIAVQDRMAFQGEYFAYRYGAQAAATAPPLRRMVNLGVPLGAGTDATRVASYNPWVALCWLATGRTVGGMQLYSRENCLNREEALRCYTRGSAWFSGEEERKGCIAPHQLADVAVLSEDYFTVPEESIPQISSVLTIVGGTIVYGAGEFAALDPPLPPVSPSWSPVAIYGGARTPTVRPTPAAAGAGSSPHMRQAHGWEWGNPGCACFVF